MLAGMGKSLLCLASLVGLAVGSVVGQERRRAPGPPAPLSHDQLVALHEQGRPFLQTQWQVRKDGALVQWPNPAAGWNASRGMSFLGDVGVGQTTPDPLVKQLRFRVRSGRTYADWLAPLLRHPGDLLAATLAERHLSQLKRDASDVALRQFLILPGKPQVAPMARRELLERELAIRLIQRRELRSARGELQAVVSRDKDAFVRRAARDALAQMAIGPKSSRVGLQDQRLAPPAHADLWLWVDLGRMPARGDIAAAARVQRAEPLWQRVLGRGRGASNSILAGCQFVVDLPDELPFEMARLWGRARVDQCLLAFCAVDGQIELAWAAASGAFEVDVLQRYLKSVKLEVEVEGDTVTSTDWWPDFVVKVAPNHVLIRRDTLTAASQRAWPAFATQAAADGDGLAAKLPKDSKLARLPWLLLERGDAAAVRLQPFALRVTTSDTEASVRARCEAAVDPLAADDPETGMPSLPPQVATAWQSALRAAKVDAAGEPGRIRLRLVGEELDPFLLWPLLR